MGEGGVEVRGGRERVAQRARVELCCTYRPSSTSGLLCRSTSCEGNCRVHSAAVNVASMHCMYGRRVSMTFVNLRIGAAARIEEPFSFYINRVDKLFMVLN